MKDTEEEKKPLVLRSCLNFGLPPIKPPPMDKDEDVSYNEGEEDGEEEEKISTPFRNNGGFSGKPSGNSKSPVNKKTKKTVKNVKKSGKGNTIIIHKRV